MYVMVVEARQQRAAVGVYIRSCDIAALVGLHTSDSTACAAHVEKASLPGEACRRNQHALQNSRITCSVCHLLGAALPPGVRARGRCTGKRCPAISSVQPSCCHTTAPGFALP